MTHADTIAAFLRQIIADPADDGPRLTFADWLEEHGHCERAELIRVQVEIAKITSELQSDEDCEDGFCVPCDDRRKLRGRAHELLTQHEPDWAGEFMPDARWTYAVSDRSFTFRDGGQAIFHWHRGFISQVECTLETWRGRTCNCAYEIGDRAWCSYCLGVGRVGGIGPALVRRAPVEAVVVTDRKPFDDLTANGTDGFGWEIEGHGYGQYQLPAELWHMLTGNTGNGLTFWRTYPSADAALSAALLAESRAALEPSGPRVVQCGT